MKTRKAIIAGCIVSFSLIFAASIYSAAHGKSMKSERTREVHRSYSELERDQEMLATDMRKLRRDLRRGVGGMQISLEREVIRQDWLNIVVDRGLKRAKVSPVLTDFGPHRWFMSRRPTRKTDA
jgi:hypothetical protein